jgi:hypothetical protein
MNANNIETNNATTRIECWNCFRLIMQPAWANDESNARLYGRSIKGCCRSCVLDFVENESADGTRIR